MGSIWQRWSGTKVCLWQTGYTYIDDTRRIGASPKFINILREVKQILKGSVVVRYQERNLRRYFRGCLTSAPMGTG